MTCKCNQSLWTRTRLAGLYKSCGRVKSMAARLWRVWWTSMDPNVRQMAHSTLVPTTSIFYHRIFSVATRPKTFAGTYQHHPTWPGVHCSMLHNSKCLQIPWRKTNWINIFSQVCSRQCDKRAHWKNQTSLEIQRNPHGRVSPRGRIATPGDLIL